MAVIAPTSDNNNNNNNPRRFSVGIPMPVNPMPVNSNAELSPPKQPRAPWRALVVSWTLRGSGSEELSYGSCFWVRVAGMGDRSQTVGTDHVLYYQAGMVSLPREVPVMSVV